jgi:hypothetical protein
LWVHLQARSNLQYASVRRLLMGDGGRERTCSGHIRVNVDVADASVAEHRDACVTDVVTSRRKLPRGTTRSMSIASSFVDLARFMPMS